MRLPPAAKPIAYWIPRIWHCCLGWPSRQFCLSWWRSKLAPAHRKNCLSRRNWRPDVVLKSRFKVVLAQIFLAQIDRVQQRVSPPCIQVVSTGTFLQYKYGFFPGSFGLFLLLFPVELCPLFGYGFSSSGGRLFDSGGWFYSFVGEYPPQATGIRSNRSNNQRMLRRSISREIAKLVVISRLTIRLNNC